MKKRGKIKDAERQLLSLEKEDVVKVKEVNEKVFGKEECGKV